MVMVMSLDGKTTQSDDPHIHSWTSLEDQKHFAKLRNGAKVIILGRKTYETTAQHMKHKPGRLRIVFTNSPQNFANAQIQDQIEFTNQNPKDVVKSLESRGFTTCLLTGGAHLNTLFLENNLIDEILLTVEPKLLGNGNPLFANFAGKANLKLEEMKTLNDQGTILLHYSVIKD